jgi:hypothetical protein
MKKLFLLFLLSSPHLLIGMNEDSSDSDDGRVDVFPMGLPRKPPVHFTTLEQLNEKNRKKDELRQAQALREVTGEEQVHMTDDGCCGSGPNGDRCRDSAAICCPLICVGGLASSVSAVLLCLRFCS